MPFVFASHLHFNPRTPHGVRHGVLGGQRQVYWISIHAPHTGCDSIKQTSTDTTYKFQSTHPTRGATLFVVFIATARSDFNPRTPHGVRPPYIMMKLEDLKISIHAPHTGCDNHGFRPTAVCLRFQSTHPTRGATSRLSRVDRYLRISIHAPHTGCDHYAVVYGEGPVHFNPRTPHGVRQLYVGARMPLALHIAHSLETFFVSNCNSYNFTYFHRHFRGEPPRFFLFA